VLLAGPTALAFFTGGYFEGPRLTAAIVAAAIGALAALVSPRVLPRSRSGRMAIAGMALLVAWVGASIAWAPVRQDAYGDFERLLLYLAVLVSAAALLRGRAALAAVEPALALGAAVVVTYGLSERLVPGLLHFQRSLGAAGRLEQPLTYWNAMGALGAMGIVLCARLAGDATRGVALRAGAAVAAAPLGAGFYLTLSRGAYGALIAGLLMLVFLSPTRSQLRGAAIVLVTGAVPALVAGKLGSVQTLHGTLSHREAQGGIALAVLLIAALGGCAATILVARAERGGRLRTAAVALPRRALLGAAVPLVVLGLIALGGLVQERHKVTTYLTPAANSQRLVSLTNDRYAYWGVALDAFAAHPLNGVGSGGFREEWLAHRTLPENARDAHSLYIETAGELGLVGLLVLGLLIAGVAGSARSAARVYPVRAPGMVAAVVALATHAGLDWDWEMPAVSLVAILLIGALVAMGDLPPSPPTTQRGLRRRGSQPIARPVPETVALHSLRAPTPARQPPAPRG
jgi:O-Antigen ligase